jgi:hypothetical protein
MKNNLTKDEIGLWEVATNELVESFVFKYFGQVTDIYWVAEEVGGVLAVNDYFFNLSDIINFIRHNYSKNKMFEYYDYSLDLYSKNKTPINIKNYIKIKK